MNDQHAPADATLGTTLLVLARRAIGAEFPGVDVPELPPLSDVACLEQAGACFVTLTLEGALRGCIGSLSPYRPLAEDVAANARGAAFRDPRFPPLGQGEFPQVRIEVSLLEPPTPLPAPTRAAALAALVPGRDGLILQGGPGGQRRATFLPQVWAQLPDPEEFLGHLLMKAGLPRDYWGPDLHLSTYRVAHWQEAPPPGLSPGFRP